VETRVEVVELVASTERMKTIWCICVEITDKVYHDVCAIDQDLARSAHPSQRVLAAVLGAG
jgi:hypothetical protein